MAVTREQVQAKHKFRRKALSSGQAKLGNCTLASVNRPHGWKPSLELMRLREIEAVIASRHGSIIPDPEDTDDLELCISYIRAVALSATAQDIRDWCGRFAPWIFRRWEELIVPIALEGLRRKKMLPSDDVAKLLCVSMAERTSLGLKTIGACDISREQRDRLAKENKRERDRNRQERKRRAAGMKDRKSHRAQTLAATRPWEAEGISRRTWFNRQKQRCTGLSPILYKANGDTSVQISEVPLPAPQTVDGQSRAAGLVAGLGDHPPAGLQGAVPHGNGDTVKGRAA
ncbi:hypothetical protein MRS76_19195 [Rhizobiaceae bacterium n13]|uniref:hypothetical protein n=1 Tax=Ferirhizobium litorale TaxID=2927786 RepID=UPI0024B2C2D2|nr:hypothetical protein [Fererhizobium litorale]MDI7864078.1 hypothetical protein [Fererhizobium litorale]